MKRAAIFDLDGTLVDSLEDISRAVNASLAARGLPVHAREAYKRMVGDGFRVLVERALPEGLREPAFVEELRAEAGAAYAARCTESTRPYPGVLGLLRELASRGLPLAVLSNKPEAQTIAVTAGCLPGIPFAFVRGDSPAFPRKPDPASALDLAGRLGLTPSDILYLGDSDVDMATARGAGMVALGAAWGYRGPEELLAAGAAAVLDEPKELLEWLGR